MEEDKYSILNDNIIKYYNSVDNVYKLKKKEVFNYLTNQKQIVSSCNYLVNAFYIEFVK